MQQVLIMYRLLIIAAYLYVDLDETVRPSETTMEEWPPRVTNHLFLCMHEEAVNEMYMEDACPRHEEN